MKERSDLLDPNSPKDVRVFQITSDESGNSNIYPDTPVFLSDRRSFLFYSHGSGYRICHPDEGYAVRPVLERNGRVQGAIASHDGRFIYYLESRKPVSEHAVALCRVDTGTQVSEELIALETIPGTRAPASRLSWGGAASTLSRDGRRGATLVYLGDGATKNAPFGVVVFDFDKGEARVIVEDPEIPSAHVQYCQSPDEDASRDLMIQMAHGAQTDEKGQFIRLLGPPSDKGVDIHVVRDDGTHWRDLPWGRDGHESCIGHQMWRGRGRSAVTVTLQNEDTTYGLADGTRQEVVEGWPVEADRLGEHLGLLNPGARRNVLSREFAQPRFCHFFVDLSGMRFAFDTFPLEDFGRKGQRVYSGWTPDDTGAIRFTYLLNAGNTFRGYHAHPILTPDGDRLLFNSNITGKPQIYMVEGPGLFGGAA